jgi:hypothetical protein
MNFHPLHQNVKVSGDEHYYVDIELTFNEHSSLSHCNTLSLYLNTSSTLNVLHVCVHSPCISSVNCSSKCHDMIANPCCHDINASISSSCYVSNNVDEYKGSIGNNKILNGASSISSSSSYLGSHICLMAKASMLYPSMEA